MSLPYSRAPHAKGASISPPEALNAALLIDFDNVTMGMRSDLSKELANLLNSEIIKGKVTVQRAYADWRRYPQYIVPLSENSVDLRFQGPVLADGHFNELVVSVGHRYLLTETRRCGRRS